MPDFPRPSAQIKITFTENTRLYFPLQSAMITLVREGQEVNRSLSEKSSYIRHLYRLLTVFFVSVLLFPTERSNAAAAELTYDTLLFDHSRVHEINVEISEADWEDLRENPTDETKYPITVTVDGETYRDVTFKTKGNTSLSSVAAMDSDRYSFKLNFGSLIKGQTYHGLKKLHLSNIFSDATYLKDYISYEIFNAAGVAAPLTSYVQLSINGEVFGLYLAIEDISGSYLDRTQNGKGELYKPSNGIDNVNDGDDWIDRIGRDTDAGASLRYTDDEIASYSDIFDNAVTDVTDEDKRKVVAALKNLSEGNVEAALDTDEVIRYFAAHNFVINGDSYTGGMLHNYFLYEKGGRLAMLPWDYNLAFGSFSGSSDNGATAVINTGIDTPITGSKKSRPMWNWISNDETYLEAYHDVFGELISGYFESGDFETEMARVYEMIRPYVANDPSAFYSVEEFDRAYQTLLDFCLLRAQSIRKQLSGDLDTETAQQYRGDRVDASFLNVSDTGRFTSGRDSNTPD